MLLQNKCTCIMGTPNPKKSNSSLPTNGKDAPTLLAIKLEIGCEAN